MLFYFSTEALVVRSALVPILIIFSEILLRSCHCKAERREVEVKTGGLMALVKREGEAKDAR